MIKDAYTDWLYIQVFPVSKATISVRGNMSKAAYEAVVSVHDSPVPAVGYSVYIVRTKAKSKETLF